MEVVECTDAGKHQESTLIARDVLTSRNNTIPTVGLVCCALMTSLLGRGCSYLQSGMRSVDVQGLFLQLTASQLGTPQYCACSSESCRCRDF